jgi:hypothetical protein
MRSKLTLLAGLAIALAGCATTDTTTEAPKPRNGIVEYQQIATDAQKSIQLALQVLDRVGSYTPPFSPKACQAFSGQVERLEAESVQVRARSQAMQARGNAYFENWQDNLDRMEDPSVRALAREHRADLEASFGRIKLGSQQARQAFQPFLAGLQQLRTALEKDPNAMAADSNKELVRTTAKNGRQVQGSLTGIQDELRHMTAMLMPGKSASKH